LAFLTLASRAADMSFPLVMADSVYRCMRVCICVLGVCAWARKP
jgi:hypothetical protein